MSVGNGWPNIDVDIVGAGGGWAKMPPPYDMSSRQTRNYVHAHPVSQSVAHPRVASVVVQPPYDDAGWAMARAFRIHSINGREMSTTIVWYW